MQWKILPTVSYNSISVKAMIFLSILRFPFFEKFVQNFGSLPVLQHNLCHLSVYTDPQLWIHITDDMGCLEARYLRLIFDLLEAGTSTVVYEAATALTALTSNPVAVVSSIQCPTNLLQAPCWFCPCCQNAAATRLLQICNKEADNNVNSSSCGAPWELLLNFPR